MSCHYHSCFALDLYINQLALTRNFFHCNTLIWTYFTAFQNATKDTFCKISIINTNIRFAKLGYTKVRMTQDIRIFVLL